ncbi:outer membrane beta-barrel protein [Polluticoccus soli]|uniref:outer membrane beta-barrel protein n=1 Tax=Polluticoccus soli TaxID=3034150 RepID=UPI0023E2D381|nr:outer membrane beta-barrel protein [Flavipsychrobacter sp. JY13-12]
MTHKLPYSFICLLLSLVATPLLGHSQSSYYLEEQRTFYGGLAAGTNITQVDGDNYKGYYNFGLNAGGVLYMRLSDRILGSMEMLYVQKGARGGINNSTIPGITLLNYRIRTDYAEVPVQVYYHDKHLNHFGAGFAYARLINTIEEVESKPVYDFHTEDYPFKKHDISFLIGGSVHLWKGFFAIARFQYSIIEARGLTPNGIAWHGQYHNVCTFRLMYLFGTKRGDD